MKIKFTIKSGSNMGEEYEFHNTDTLLIGRDSQKNRLHLNINDNFVSSLHAIIDLSETQCNILDFRSANGTYILRGEDVDTLYYFQGLVGDSRDIPLQLNYSRSCLVSGKFVLMDEDIIIFGQTMVKLRILDDHMSCKNFKRFQQDLSSPTNNDQNNMPKLFCHKCGSEIVKKKQSCFPEDLRDKNMNYTCASCMYSMISKNETNPFGDYHLIKLIGTGPVGSVYLAFKKPDGETVAIKIIHEKNISKKELMLRFINEISISRKVHHKNIIKFYDYGILDKALLYFVFEYMPGGNLQDLIQRRNNHKLSVQEVCTYMYQALKGLAALHNAGYVHRDIKPGNIFIKSIDNGQLLAKIGDFGFAKNVTSDCLYMTNTGDYPFGTYPYLPPEQILDIKRVGPVSDLYAMGVTMYYLLTGEYPYVFNTRQERSLMAAAGEQIRHPTTIIIQDEPMPVENKLPDLPEELILTVNKAMQKDPLKRFKTARQFQEKLETWL